MFHVKHRNRVGPASLTSLGRAFSERTGSHDSRSTRTTSENEQFKRAASLHVPRETSLDLTLPATSTFRSDYLGAESCIVNREYACSFQADRSHEPDLRSADALRHIVTPNGRRAPHDAAPSGRALGAAGCSDVTAPHGAGTSKRGAPSTHAIAAGRPSSPSSAGSSPTTSANTDPPVYMNLPTVARQSACRHIKELAECASRSGCPTRSAT